MALRKILKKHDKLCKNDRGRVFLQQCWCSTSADGIGLFLHSPLLDELKAVQDVLQQKLDAEFEKNQELQHHEVDDEEVVAAGASHNVPVKGEISGKRSTDTAGHRPQHHHNEEPCDESESSEAIFGSIAEETGDDFVSPLKTAAASKRLSHDAPPSIGRGSPSLMSDGGDRSPCHLSGSPTDGHHGFFPSTTSQSSDGLRGALAASHSGNVSFRSLTSPSLRAQRAAALAAIAESPHLRMLSSSDLEWADLSAEYSATSGDVHHRDVHAPAGNHRSREAAAHTTEKGLPHATSLTKGHRRDRSGIGAMTVVTIASTSDQDFLPGVDPDAPTPSAPRSRVASSTISTNLERFSNDPRRSTEDMLPSGFEARPGGESRQSVVGASSPAVPDGGSSGVGPAVGPFQDDELRCPVCLEIMYKPVGLGCGHKFCKPCALEAAGFGKCFGSFQNIASYVPSRTPCPTCRQKNVYQSAVSLREVGALIQKRFPENWAERREAEKHKFSDDETLSVPRRTRLRGASPFEILSTTSSMDIVSE